MSKTRPFILRLAGLLILAAVVVGGLFFLNAAGQRKKPTGEIPTATIQRQDIVVTVEADGTIEPINVVEVKSKASGQIVKMPVEIGSTVHAGDLLAQIDPRDVQNQYDQTFAALKAAEVRADVARAQKGRSDQLIAEQVITAQEHEAATLDLENAQAQLVKGRTDLDLARQRLEDATVRAPITGTVIDKPVSAGQVISSATSSASGGTTLLSMADLKKIRLRALVSETDIGHVKMGQVATVAVDAYSGRMFQGVVEKVEPRALVEQSVTMFPVLVSLQNEDGLLLPGMNGEVTLMVESEEGVLAVPVDAVRGVRELSDAAAALGIDPDSIQAQVRRAAQMRRPSQTRPTDAGAAAVSRGGRGGRGGRRDSTASSRQAGAAAPDSTRRGSGVGRFVFVKTADGFTPRAVRLGLSNYDFIQVVGGLEEGEEVALLSAALLQRQREQSLERMRQRVGGAVPGVQGQSGGAPRAGGP